MDINGFRRFLLCTNDHSWFSWLYLLKQKSEIAKVPKNFSHLIKREIGVHVLGYQTDNAQDFCNSKLKEFF